MSDSIPSSVPEVRPELSEATPLVLDSIKPIAIGAQQMPVKRKATTKRYWVGIVPGSPLITLSKGGVVFQQRTGMKKFSAEVGEEGKLLNPLECPIGDVLELTDEQVQVALQRIAGSFLRPMPGVRSSAFESRGKPSLVHVSAKQVDEFGAWSDDPRHEVQVGDVPLGTHLFMAQVGDKPFDRTVIPPTLVPPAMVVGE